MQISAKTRLICLIVALVFALGSLIGTGTYLIINHLNNSNALKGGSSIGDIIKTDDRTSINGSVYTSLIEKLGDRTGQIEELDQGSPIVFSMAGRNWQVVYRDPNNSDIITVWMTDYYTTSQFNGSGYNYNGSILQQTVLNYFNTQSQNYPVLSNITISPNSENISATYKKAQDQGYTYGSFVGVSGKISNLNDKFWIPSLYETFYFWGLDDADRATSSSSYSWLRSGSQYYDPGRVIRLGPSGNDIGHIGCSSSLGVRPACHISLDALYANAKFTINAETNNTNYGIVSDNSGVYDSNTVITITATPYIGCIFVHWELDGQPLTGAGSTYTFTITKDQTYTAVFRLAETIITTANDGNEILQQLGDSNNISQEYLLHFVTPNYVYKISINDFNFELQYTVTTLTNITACTSIEFIANDNAS